MDLFSQIDTPRFKPLAERLRPQELKDFVGQEKILGPSSLILKNLREQNYLPNLILWGPPGTGKTTFALLISRLIKAHFEICNAIDTGAKDLKELGAQARNRRREFGEKTIIFIDEIHRLNRAQQDVLLPFTERGDFILIGATTENPGYELTSALLSRAKVLVFEPLQNVDLEELLKRAEKDTGVEIKNILTDEAKDVLFENAAGDARRLLTTIESLIQLYKSDSENAPAWPLTVEGIESLNLFGPVRYDKDRDEHYNVISAFIKSVRGSDPDAAVYYLARMLEGGEDPIFVARRLVILASEDIGNADPKALPLAVAGLQAVELVGMPEARISLAQVTTYLASAPKSNRAYMALENAAKIVKEKGALSVPKPLRSDRTKISKEFGHGQNYKYAHNHARGFVEQDYLPEAIRHLKFYEPSEFGFEKSLKQHLEWLRGKKPDEEKV